jgi:predicted TIM-barrel fold metal-dependent hydrolase
VVLAHLGSFLMWDEVEQYLVGANVFFDTSYTLDFIRPEQFKKIVKNHGIEKILFGTDSPWADQAKEIKAVKNLGFSEKELELIFFKNAAGLLGLT